MYLCSRLRPRYIWRHCLPTRYLVTTKWAATTSHIGCRCAACTPTPISITSAKNRRQAMSTYVSPHFQVRVADVEEYLTRKGLTFRQSGNRLEIKECPFCHPIRGLPSNQWKLSVFLPAGAHNCFRCGSKGSWFDFKQRMGDLQLAINTAGTSLGAEPTSSTVSAGSSSSAPTSSSSSGSPSSSASPNSYAPPPSVNVQPPQNDDLDQSIEFDPTEYTEALRRPQYSNVRDYLLSTVTPTGGRGRGLSAEALALYGVGATTAKFLEDKGQVEHVCVTFPWLSTTGPNPKVIRVKIRSITNKRCQRLHPKGGGWGFFGWDTVAADAKEVVITEGEFDAIAVRQATGMGAISLPNGARSLPPQLIPCLERFEKIYLWMDDDIPGREGAEQFARKLGLKRCFLVRPHPSLAPGATSPSSSSSSLPPVTMPKDANEALLHGWDLKALLDKAAVVGHSQIATFASLRDEVFKEITQPKSMVGVPSPSLSGLTRLLKGHRRGELTILTGPTGVGKTTLLSQLSLDYCKQGVVTLWGSFEIKNARLAKTMLLQHCAADLARQPELYDAAADEFETLPLYFLRFFGGCDLDHVVDAMEYACYVHDVAHIVLDNLQFMLSHQPGNSWKAANDKFAQQDRAVSTLRHFATTHNVHITLVIHPRKEEEGSSLGMSSVFGSAKATQEADNVVIIQRVPSTAIMDPDTVSKKGFAAQTALDNVLARYRRIDVKKNRFDGDLGSFPLLFDRRNRMLREVEPEAMVNEVKNELHATLMRQSSEAFSFSPSSSSSSSSSSSPSESELPSPPPPPPKKSTMGSTTMKKVVKKSTTSSTTSASTSPIVSAVEMPKRSSSNSSSSSIASKTKNGEPAPVPEPDRADLVAPGM